VPAKKRAEFDVYRRAASHDSGGPLGFERLLPSRTLLFPLEEEMKIAFVEAFFPELKGKYIYRTGRGEASNNKAAISRAMGDLFKGVKGKRFSCIKCTITLTEKADNEVQVIKEAEES